RRLVVHDGAVDLGAREGANRVERLPACDDDHFDLAVALALEEPRAAVTRDGGQLGHDDASEMRGVLGRAFPRAACRPDALDHRGWVPGSAPRRTTTVQGRTRQPVTSPSRTYGSARANSSTTDAESARNTSKAPSGGWPSAPAITS